MKIGGAMVDKGIENLIEDIANLSKEHRIVIVHGGGPQINERAKRLGRSRCM